MKITKQTIVSLIFAGAAFFTSCKKDDNTNDADQVTGYDYSEILEDYVDNTIVPTYADMKDNAILLYNTVKAFKVSKSQADLDQAAVYWEATRAPWEEGEAFLFGPAAYNNLDPLLDSWPLDQTQLNDVLAGGQELNAEYVRNGLGAVLRGFHTVEYLLFKDGDARDASTVTDRELEYLVAVSQVLRDDCVTLWALWAGVEDGSAEAEMLEAIEVEIGTPYGDEFKTAGQVGSRYVTQTDAVDEMLQGMIGIADEVANGKIAEPHSSGNVLDVESWFSWNSLIDFQNNIRSIENSYLGGYDPAAREASLSAYIAEKDEALDTRVKTAIQEAITAIGDIPEPFRNNLQHANVKTAMAKVSELQTIIEEEVRPLVIN